MHVEVQEYHPEWSKQFQNIKQELEGTLQDIAYIGIEHEGSTSVPGLSAKAVIDIDIIATKDQLQAVLAGLNASGKYKSETELSIPDRYAIATIRTRYKDGAVLPKRNIYVCVEGSQALRNHLAVRDLCRNDEEVREEYSRVKRELATREWRSVDDYCTAKTEVLAWILRKAGFDGDEIREVRKLNGLED